MIYLDNAATSFPKPEPVYWALEAFARGSMGNPWKGEYRLAADAQRAMDGARGVLDGFFRGEGSDRWIHTFNGTDGLNIAIKGSLRKGDRVVTSDLEHDSVTRPLHAPEEAGTIKVTRVASDGGFSTPTRSARPSARRRPWWR